MMDFKYWGYCYLCLYVVIFKVASSLRNQESKGDEVSFRTRTSTLSYQFPFTETMINTTMLVEFSTIRCSGMVMEILSKDRSPSDFYRVTITHKGNVTFTYRLSDDNVAFEVSPPNGESFCDGKRHELLIVRFGRKVQYRVNNGKLHEHKEKELERVTFSKPGKIVLGGMGDDSFYGCIQKAVISVHWSTNPVSTINVLKLYSSRDPKVNGVNAVIGGCVSSGAECKPDHREITLSFPKGSIATPLPGQRFTDTNSCAWTLEAPQDYRIKLQLRLISVNDSSKCARNYVEILQGRGVGSKMISRHCNHMLTKSAGQPVYSLGRYLTVVLWRNGTDTIEFVATYTAVNLSEGPCPARGDLRGPNGTFTSPEYPYNYDSNRACSWVISVPRHQHILITFEPSEFNIAGCHDNCLCDFLEIREVESGLKNAYGRYCGSIAPSPIYYPGSRLSVGFVSDNSKERRGFRAFYQATKSLLGQCPEHLVLTDMLGTIKSPRFPLPYPGKLDCLWEVRGESGSRIEFLFDEPLFFDIECTDYLELSDGKTNDSRTYVKKYCISSKKPLPFVTDKNRLFVRFKSDGYQVLNGKKYGFSATFVIRKSKSAKKVSGTMLITGTPLMTTSFILLSVLAASDT